MLKSKLIRMASAILVLLGLTLPVAQNTMPAYAATGVAGQVIGNDAAGAPGVANIVVTLVRNSDAAIIASTLTQIAGGCGAGTPLGCYSFPPAFTDQSGAFTLLFADQRGCGSRNSANPSAAMPGCPLAGGLIAGCAVGTICGYLPSAVPITLVGGAITFAAPTVTLTAGAAPAVSPGATFDGGFGSVLNLQGFGLGGLTITAFLAGTSVGAPPGAVVFTAGPCGTATAPTTGAAGCVAAGAAATAFNTGAWAIPGLKATSTAPVVAGTCSTAVAGASCDYFFIVSGPGVTGNVLSVINPLPTCQAGCVTGAGEPSFFTSLPMSEGAWWDVSATLATYVNAGSFFVNLPLSAPIGRGFVTATVLNSAGVPLGNATCVLTDSTGATYATTTTGAGGCAFTGTPAGTGVFTGAGKLVIADNDNDYVGCPSGAACGFSPQASTSVTVTSGTTTSAGTFTLANKIAPVNGSEGVPAAGLAAGNVGFFGYAVNGNGNGLPGLIVSVFPTASAACLAAINGAPGVLATAVAACGAVLASSVTAVPPAPAAGTGTVVTDAATGRFRGAVAVGAGTGITLMLSGPGINAASCLTPIPGNAGGTNTCVDQIPAVGAAGTWVDPVFVAALGGAAAPTASPIAGTGTITGIVTDANGVAGAGMTAVLYSLTTRQIVAALPAGAIPGPGVFYTASANPQIVAANGTFAFVGLAPGNYTVTILDDRQAAGGEFGCPASAIPALTPGGIPAIACGSLPSTQVASVAVNGVSVLNFQLAAQLTPGVLNAVGSGATLAAGGIGIFGEVVDSGGTGAANAAAGAVNGYAPVQGARVYAITTIPGLSCAPPIGDATNAFACASLAGNVNVPGYIAPGGIIPGGASGVIATATTDSTGRYQMVAPAALAGAAGAVIDIAIELPQAYNACAGGVMPYAGTQLGTNTVAPLTPGNQATAQLAPGPGYGVTRCTISLGAVATAAAPGTGFAPAGAGPVAGAWNDGASFVVSSQNLVTVPGGENATRRLEAIVPFYSNTPDTTRLGGWDLETQEIRVGNAGAARTVAELDFFATDSSGNPSTAATQTVDLVPGQAASLRPQTPGIGSQIPGGSIGWVGIFSTIPTGQVAGGLYSLSELAATYATSAANAAGATEVNAAIPRGDIVSPGSIISLPIAFRNYGGTAAKWSSQIVVDNLGAGTTVEFSLNQLDSQRGGVGPCQVNCNITRYANAAGVALLNLGDNTQSDVAQLTDFSTYNVDVVVTGGVTAPYGYSLGLLGAQPNILPAGYVVTEFNVTTVGKAMTQLNGVSQPVIGASATGFGGVPVIPQNVTSNAWYLPLVFKNYNCSATDLAATQANGTPCGWNTGVSIGQAQSSIFGSGTVAWSLALYDRGGQFLGNYTTTISAGNEWRTLYLPTVPWLPDGFSGTAVVNGAIQSNNNNIFGNLEVTANSVNYGRNQAIATNAITATTAANRTDDVGSLPCTANGFASCIFFTKFAKGENSTNKFGPFGGATASGENVGIRIFNPVISSLETVQSIPGLTSGLLAGVPANGNPAQITVQYTDDAGVTWPVANEQIVVPAFGTATLFPLDNFTLPQLFSGTAYVQSTGNYVVSMANVVNYSITDHDVSGAYLGQYSNGHLQ